MGAFTQKSTQRYYLLTAWVYVRMYSYLPIDASRLRLHSIPIALVQPTMLTVLALNFRDRLPYENGFYALDHLSSSNLDVTLE